MRIAIFGANGQTGRLATRHALDAGHTTIAVTRRPGDFPFTDPALTVAEADVHDADAVADIVANADAVLSTLGVPFTEGAGQHLLEGHRKHRHRDAILGRDPPGGGQFDGRVSAPGRTGAPFALRLFEPVTPRPSARPSTTTSDP